MDLGVMGRWGITPSEFDRAIVEYPDDHELVAWLAGRVTDAARERGNQWVLHERASSLQRQEDEEGVTAIAGLPFR
jgi:hypothetical protein